MGQNTGSDVGSVDVHPFHAHGAHYYDLGSGNGTYDPVANEEIIKGLDLAQRDTTMLYKYSEKTTPGIDMGWRAWRLRVTEPGVWMIHCHILQHMVMGECALLSPIILFDQLSVEFHMQLRVIFVFDLFLADVSWRCCRNANSMGDG